MSAKSNHEPIEDAYSQQMNQIAGFLEDVFNGDLRGEARKIGFVLLVFPLHVKDPETRCNYISNSVRKDVVKLLREQANRLDENIQ